MIRRNNQKGFSLIELVVVVAILGLFALIARSRFEEYRNQAWDTARLSEMISIGSVIEANAAATGKFPANVNHPAVCAIGSDYDNGKCLGEIFDEISSLQAKIGFSYYFNFDTDPGLIVPSANKAVFPKSKKYLAIYTDEYPTGMTPFYFLHSKNQFRKDCTFTSLAANCPGFN